MDPTVLLFQLKKAVATLLLPPVPLLLMLTWGLLYARRSRWGLRMAWLGLILLVVTAMPVTGRALIDAVSEGQALRLDQLAAMPEDKRPQVLVILGGGSRKGAIEWPEGEKLKPDTLQRVHYGAWLARETGLPLVVTGGRPLGTQFAEGELMQQVLERDFQLKVAHAETASLDTTENARLTAALLPADTRRILLVTHIDHMRRARREFEQAGFSVTAAPMGFRPDSELELSDFIPGVEAWGDSQTGLYQWLGERWFELRAWIKA